MCVTLLIKLWWEINPLKYSKANGPGTWGPIPIFPTSPQSRVEGMLRYRQCAMSRASGLAPSYQCRGPSFASLPGQIHVRVEHADTCCSTHPP